MILLLHLMLAIVFMFQQTFLAEPLVVEHEGSTIAELNRSDYTYVQPGIPLVNSNKLDQFMDDLDKRLYIAPINATLDSGGKIISEIAGSKLNRKLFKEKVYGYIFEGELLKLEVPLQRIYPRVDSELLAQIKGKKIGMYFTYYNNNNKNRAYNIGLAAKAINNYVLFPNEVFSFNKVVGKRTVEKGYMRAPIIVRGEVSEGVGGGICQISSTLYNAADRAGLQIVERYSHSRHVPYVPSGRDATVSWYGPDFTFKNTYDQPILIRAFAHAGQVSIIICSSDEVEEHTRKVPSASKKLPEEIAAERNVHHIER